MQTPSEKNRLPPGVTNHQPSASLVVPQRPEAFEEVSAGIWPSVVLTSFAVSSALFADLKPPARSSATNDASNAASCNDLEAEFFIEHQLRQGPAHIHDTLMLF